MSFRPDFPAIVWEESVVAALREDLGRAGDRTTAAIVPEGSTATGRLVARRPGRIAGVEVALAAFERLDGGVVTEIESPDGTDVEAGATVATVRGDARALLSAERVALNFLGHLSGIATATADLVARAAGRAAIACTRKTTPGLRTLEKYAVRVGGGMNHRFGLDDAVLIKDNHRRVAGSTAEAVGRARSKSGHMVKIEVEVDDLEQLEEALAAGADILLLDNMSAAELRRAVEIAAGRAVLEASGGITPDRVAEVAATGVDLISVGWITHSAPTLDVALDLDEPFSAAR